MTDQNAQFDASVTELLRRAQAEDRFADGEKESSNGTMHEAGDVVQAPSVEAEPVQTVRSGEEVAPPSGTESTGAAFHSDVDPPPSTSAPRNLVGPCTRCGHIWPSDLPTPPRCCPQCHSAYWDRPRKFRAPYLDQLPVKPAAMRKSERAKWRFQYSLRRRLQQARTEWGEATTFTVFYGALDPSYRRRIAEMYRAESEGSTAPVGMIEVPRHAPPPQPAAPPRPSESDRGFVIPPPPGMEERR